MPLDTARAVVNVLSKKGQRVGGAGAMGLPLGLQHTHAEYEDDSWKIALPDHAQRTASAGFRASKELAKKIVAALGASQEFYGSDSLQMHHGGSLWVSDEAGWFMVQNQAGIEWSAQFCADPAKVDSLRLNARRLYAGFPLSLPGMVRLGYEDAGAILNTAITDAAGVATWVDSIFNSCVPLPAVRHVGTLPKGGGRHHYPTPITDIELIKYDDYNLWVTDEQQHPVAVVPTAKRGAGVSRVRLAYATPNTPLDAAHASAHEKNSAVEFGPDSDLTKQAFEHQ
jgi:Family of unknown function (DUF6424)